ncbi:MAG: hypothetical protein ACPLTR_06360 [Thermacetogeniaceae bacterium]
MQLSNEWVEFLRILSKKGSIPVTNFSTYFKNSKKAEKSLGEIIRQGLIDLDLSTERIFITKKGKEFIEYCLKR